MAAGPEALVEAAQRPADWVMAAIMGAAGLAPTLAAIRRGAIVALANKETLVSAGPFMMAEIERHGATLLPVDSEHSAIFQVFDLDNLDAVERIVLTASGGPFRRLERSAMAAVTPAQAVAHPVWDMGAKISVDSATMMNKGLELIEAHQLFRLPGERNRDSGASAFRGAQPGRLPRRLGTGALGSPDMRTPIGYALAWPRRMATPVEPSIWHGSAGSTSSRRTRSDFRRSASPARHWTMAARRRRSSTPPTRPRVHEFLGGRIGFLDIMEVVERTLGALPSRTLTSLDDVVEVDRHAREVADRFAAGLR